MPFTESEKVRSEKKKKMVIEGEKLVSERPKTKQQEMQPRGQLAPKLNEKFFILI